MKLVIDANIVVAALIKEGKVREIIASRKFELVSPDFVLDEIKKYEGYICEKSGLGKDEFELLMALIFQNRIIASSQEYEAHKEIAKKLIEKDVKDVPYVACYLALKCDKIWTNDYDYKGKKEIKTISTAELNEMLRENNNEGVNEKP